MNEHILVIEDDDSIRTLLQLQLEREGYQVSLAADGEEGIVLAAESQPDLVLCDVTMPDLDGYSVLSELRQQVNFVDVPIIMISANEDREYVRLGMELGASDYLTKPFLTSEVLIAVQTQLKRLQRRKQVYQRQVDRITQGLTYAMPHELRTPLMVIMGYSGLLKEDIASLPGEHAEMIEAIANSGKRLHQVVERVLNYAQVELAANNKTIPPLSTASTGQIEGIAVGAATQAGRTNDLEISQDVFRVAIAPEQFVIVVGELIDNAFKFSPVGSPVEVVAQQIDGVATITVTDYGLGMTQAQIDAIGPFTQFNRSMNEQQGIGLGLYLAKRIASLHNGKLSIHSIPGRQTTVTVQLPLHLQND